MSGAIVAVLDTCVLYPAVLRDTLLLAAEAGVFEFLWTDQIIEELRRNLIGNRAAPQVKVDKMLADFSAAFVDGKVTDFEHHIESLANHPKDRHVVAAALEARAEYIVTKNLKDFAPAAMPKGTRAISVDDFLLELFERDSAEMVDILWRQATRKRRPPVSVERLVGAVGRHAPGFVDAVRPLLGVRTDAQILEILERQERAVENSRAGSGSVEELSVSLADGCTVDPELARLVAVEARRFAPEAVRVLAQLAMTGTADVRTEAARLLRRRGLDITRVDVTKLSDEEVVALLERAQEETQ